MKNPGDSKYSNRPYQLVQNVRVYRPADDPYVENYEKIASDHAASQEVGLGNPFIEEQIWKDLEANTIDLISIYAKDCDSIVDVGVGTGRLLAHFPKLERYGLDISLTYISRLGSSGIQVCVGAIEDLPYASDAFDIVVCTDVLEHVIDLHKALLELKRVIRPGGVLIVRVPYREDLSLYLEPEYPYQLAHVRNFDEHGLRLQFERVHGFVRLDERFDRAFSPSRFFLPFPRGRTQITKLVDRLARGMGNARAWALRLYRPVSITVAYRKV